MTDEAFLIFFYIKSAITSCKDIATGLCSASANISTVEA